MNLGFLKTPHSCLPQGAFLLALWLILFQSPLAPENCLERNDPSDLPPSNLTASQIHPSLHSNPCGVKGKSIRNLHWDLKENTGVQVRWLSGLPWHLSFCLQRETIHDLLPPRQPCCPLASLSAFESYSAQSKRAGHTSSLHLAPRFPVRTKWNTVSKMLCKTIQAQPTYRCDYSTSLKKVSSFSCLCMSPAHVCLFHCMSPSMSASSRVYLQSFWCLIF